MGERRTIKWLVRARTICPGATLRPATRRRHARRPASSDEQIEHQAVDGFGVKWPIRENYLVGRFDTSGATPQRITAGADLPN